MVSMLFISGKNWRLSLAEIAAYLKTSAMKFEIKFFSKDFFVIEFTENFDASAIEALGGTIKIGEDKVQFPTQIVREAFVDKNKNAQSQITESLTSSGLVEQISGSTDKLFFGVSIYSAENPLRPLSGIIQRFVGSAIKDELKRYGKKSKFMGFPKIDIQLN
jgi:hypothetical protein